MAEQADEIYGKRHLPQGAPTSPAIANYCAFRLDSRLCGLAAVTGGTYSRYADDLAFSGNADFARRAGLVRQEVSNIVRDEEFRLNEAKSKTLSPGQRQLATGIVLNAGTGVPREYRKRLEAMLTNCVKDGLAEQNRENHADFRAQLLGGICWVETVNPVQGAKLRRIFEKIPG